VEGWRTNVDKEEKKGERNVAGDKGCWAKRSNRRKTKFKDGDGNRDSRKRVKSQKLANGDIPRAREVWRHTPTKNSKKGRQRGAATG